MDSEESEKTRASSNVLVLHTTSAAVHVVGTAHISRESCDEVRELIRSVKPQVVFLELCLDRISILSPPTDMPLSGWNDVRKMLREPGDVFTALYSWLLSKMGASVDVRPGEEFRIAYNEAMACGAQVTLGDRPVQVTLRRTWARLSSFERMKLLFSLLVSAIWLPSGEKLVSELEELKNGDVLSLAMGELGKSFPSIVETLVKERDLYMAATLRQAAANRTRVVAVVGKGHMEGMRANWGREDIDIDSLLEVPQEAPPVIMSWRASRTLLLATAAVGVVALVAVRVLRSKSK